jgi:hypothetical protein
LQLGVIIRVQASEFGAAAHGMDRLQVNVKMEESSWMALRSLMLMRMQRRRFYKRE